MVKHSVHPTAYWSDQQRCAWLARLIEENSMVRDQAAALLKVWPVDVDMLCTGRTSLPKEQWKRLFVVLLAKQ